MVIKNFNNLQTQLTEKQTKLQSLLSRYPEYATSETSKALTGLTPATTPTPEPETPMVKFSHALLGMMDRASRGVSAVSKQQEGVERTAAGAYKQPYEGQETLTPQQRLGLMETSGQEYQPTIKGLSTRISQFEKIFDIAKETYGEDFSNILDIAPSKETLEDYRRAFRQGESLSTIMSGLNEKTRAKVFSVLQDEDYKANTAAGEKAKTPSAGDKATAYYQIRQRAADLFKDGMTTDEYKQSQDELRSYGLGEYLNDFDKWVTDMGYLTPVTQKELGIPGKEKPATVAKNKVGFVVDGMMGDNESVEEITSYIKAEGYDPADDYFSKKLEGYQPKTKTSWWETQGKKFTDLWEEF